ncbi:MAG: hypothetical protein Q8P24_13875 [Desulfobacterales bacterium]|nr:hypothetical protein [Desulfobacterales bacterium]
MGGSWPCRVPGSRFSLSRRADSIPICDLPILHPKTYFFFEMMTYLLVTPIIFFFCMADTTFALKRSEERGD